MSTDPEPLLTPLHAIHRELDAHLTDFAGWQMPLRYGSAVDEHHAVRAQAGLFDLSQMGQIEVSGPGAAAALDYALVTRPSTMAVGRARYALMLAEDGGILDDLIVYRLAGEGDQSSYLVIANAANRMAVLDALTGRSQDLAGTHVADRTESRALIALQGPVSGEVLAPMTTLDKDSGLGDLAELRYYRAVTGRVAGVPALIARTGYTGETGYEISVPAPSAVALWRALTEAGAAHGVIPCGLAARDSLRLEAGMPLYGQEIRRDLIPADSGLERVVNLDPEHDFVGREAVQSRTASHTLAALTGTGRRAARAGSTVHRPGEAATLGTVSSGILSPTLGHPIALALIENAELTSGSGTEANLPPGTEVEVDVRGRRQSMTVTETPFYRRPS